MEKIISCCGVVCSECRFYPEDCGGCNEIKGKVFWLDYTGGDVCSIYKCTAEKDVRHCGGCGELPCGNYSSDPTLSEEENRDILARQLEVLKELAAKDKDNKLST